MAIISDKIKCNQSELISHSSNHLFELVLVMLMKKKNQKNKIYRLFLILIFLLLYLIQIFNYSNKNSTRKENQCSKIFSLYVDMSVWAQHFQCPLQIWQLRNKFEIQVNDTVWSIWFQLHSIEALNWWKHYQTTTKIKKSYVKRASVLKILITKDSFNLDTWVHIFRDCYLNYWHICSITRINLNAKRTSTVKSCV